jgi:hypothetical protein
VSVPARISLVTLGVRDLAGMVGFYERLGWRKSSASAGDVAFFHTGGGTLALFPAEELAKDARVDARGEGFRRVALAINVPEKADVDAAIESAKRAGATITKPAEDAFWGGRSGYFADPEGNLWEVAWNPGFPLKEDGSIRLP